MVVNVTSRISANSLAARGHEVHAVVRPNSPLLDELSLPSANVTTLPLRNALDARSASALAKLVRVQKIEIVHAHMARDYPLAAYAVRRNPGARLIVTRHVLFPLNRLHKVTLAHVSRVIAVSHAVARELKAQALIAPDKITVIQNGIDLKKIDARAKSFPPIGVLSALGVAGGSFAGGKRRHSDPLKRS